MPRYQRWQQAVGAGLLGLVLLGLGSCQGQPTPAGQGIQTWLCRMIGAGLGQAILRRAILSKLVSA